MQGISAASAMAGTWVFEDVVNVPLTIFLLQVGKVLQPWLGLMAGEGQQQCGISCGGLVG